MAIRNIADQKQNTVFVKNVYAGLHSTHDLITKTYTEQRATDKLFTHFIETTLFRSAGYESCVYIHCVCVDNGWYIATS